MRGLALACVFLSGLAACGDGADGAGAGELEGFICTEDGETRSVQEAAEKGDEVAHRGRCDEPMRCDAPEDCFVGDDCASPSSDGVPVCVPGRCVCPSIFAPVCGVDGRTYGSSCEAVCMGVDIVRDGYCDDPPGGGCERSGCSGQLCVEVGTDVVSTCEWLPAYQCYQDATCERQPNGQCGFTPTPDLVECLEGFGDCVCPAIDDPVCGVDGKSYSNACQAECAGVEIAYEGECLEVCVADNLLRPTIYEPVCGVDDQTYGNLCQAEVAGVAVAYKGECVDGGDCQELGCPTGFTCDTCMFSAESSRSVCLPPNAGACLPPADN